MKIELLVIGKTQFKYLDEGFKEYQKRLLHYINFEMVCIPDIKQDYPIDILKIKEGEAIINHLSKRDTLNFLLDDKGKTYSSLEFAQLIEDKLNFNHKNLCFIIGGAYGYSSEVYALVPNKISFSKLTFSHQLIRLIFAEQIYRAFTIIHKKPYHHE